MKDLMLSEDYNIFLIDIKKLIKLSQQRAFNSENNDMIEHKQNVYLAKPFDTTDLKDGIAWILNAPNYEELCENAREKLLREFNNEVVVQKYIELYNKVLND